MPYTDTLPSHSDLPSQLKLKSVLNLSQLKFWKIVAAHGWMVQFLGETRRRLKLSKCDASLISKFVIRELISHSMAQVPPGGLAFNFQVQSGVDFIERSRADG